MNIKPFPYEFMARFSDGQLQGYHVVLTQIACGDNGLPLKKENGENLLEQIGEATTLERAGLDLSQLLDSTLQGAIMSMDTARAEMITAVNARATAETDLQQEKQARITAESEREELRVQLQSALDQLAAK